MKKTIKKEPEDFSLPEAPEVMVPETVDEVWEAHRVAHNIRLVIILGKARQ